MTALLLGKSGSDGDCSRASQKGRYTRRLRTRPPLPAERQVRGEAVNTARLTSERVREIRERHATGNTSYSRLAQEYGVTKEAVRAIVKRWTWKHV